MNLTFNSWLFNQKDRQDQIGKLARFLNRLDHRPVQQRGRSDEHKKWANIITRHGEPEHIRAFNLAWHEYQIASQGMGTTT